MKRSTNRKILNFALLPLIGIITVYLAFPEMLKATDASNAFHPLVSYFWVLAILGGFIFWLWGVAPHVVSLFMDPLERETKAGRVKPNSWDEKALKSLWLFRLLNIYIDAD